MNNNIFCLLWIWGIFNLFIGIWEIYAFANRDKLLLTPDTIWNKIKNGTTTFKTFWIDAWIEYCKVDSRYIKKYSQLEYVWVFEIINAILSIFFIIFLLQKNIDLLKIILLLIIINCICYFGTLILEIYENEKQIILQNIKQYASRWMIPAYYFISSIWIIIPTIMYMKL
jgi:hypothetical protein